MRSYPGPRGRTQRFAVVRDAARSYLRTRLPYDHEREGTTAPSRVRPGARRYDHEGLQEWCARHRATGDLAPRLPPAGSVRIRRSSRGSGRHRAAVEPISVRNSTDLGAELNRSRRVPTACCPPPRSRDMTRPAAPGCLSRPAGPCRRGARTPGSHIRGSTSSFAGAIGAGSLRPASTSATDRSSGSPTLTTRPVRRQ